MAREPFLDSFNLLARWTAIFAFNNFSFPESRAKNINIKIKISEIILTMLKVCILLVLVITNRKLSNSNKTTATSITELTVILANSLGLVIFLINIIKEFQNRRRLWAIISGLCDVDNVVRHLI